VAVKEARWTRGDRPVRATGFGLRATGFGLRAQPVQSSSAVYQGAWSWPRPT